MADFDILVIGGGPAGYAAALKASELGASVALVEAETPGGACVNHSCIPTNILMASVRSFLEAQELGVLGLFEAGNTFSLARAAARKDTLVRQVADGVRAALRMRKVRLIEGRAAFASPTAVSVQSGEGAPTTITAGAFVIATGTRWEPSAIPGVPAARVLTADAVQALSVAPPSALVLADSPADVPFGAEYAALLAVAGTKVTIVTTAGPLFRGLDPALAPAALTALTDLGIDVHEGVTVEGIAADRVRLTGPRGAVEVAAAIVVAADPRLPFFASLDLPAAGVRTTGCIPVDRTCRTNVASIFAAGDVTAGPMLTAAATHMGEVAGANAAGGQAVTRLARLPRLVHTYPEVGWVGLTEAAAREAGHTVAIGAADVAYNARAVALGAKTGAVKVIADRDLGEVLGVHAVGPEAAEVIAVAAALMQAEVPLAEVAAMSLWHPSLVESLAEAARRAL